MPINPYLKQYKKTQIETTPKEQILLMLYDGSVRFLHLAKEGFAEKNIEKIHNNLIKVQNIITEFESTLDMENGGEFAKNLFALYEFMSRQLVRANMKKDEAALDVVIKHMTELRDTWREAVKKFKAEGNSLSDIDTDKYNSSTENVYQDTASEDDDEENEDDDEENIGEYI